jgi:hypothetical protein
VPGDEVLRLVNGEAESLEEVAATNGAPHDTAESADGEAAAPEDATASEEASAETDVVEETTASDGTSEEDEEAPQNPSS